VDLSMQNGAQNFAGHSFFFIASPAQPGPWDDIPIKYVCIIFRHTLHHPTMGIENQPLETTMGLG
jgi:hypothetical protein